MGPNEHAILSLPECEAQELKIPFRVHAYNLAFLPVHPEFEFSFQVSPAGFQQAFPRPRCPGQHHNVVRVPYARDSSFSKLLVKFIEIDVGTDVEIEKTINLDKVWENLLYESKQDYRKEIIANLDLGAITWDYGEEAGEDPYCSSVDFDGGEGANRTGQTGEAPDFQYEYYFWRKDTPPASFDELERNRTEYLRWNETHTWPEVTLRNLNKDKQVDSRPYISLWAIGYWKSLSGRYEILEDRTILDELMMNVYSKDGEAVARQKYNAIRFGLEDIIDQYHMRGDDFDRNNIPDAYRAYESLLNTTFGTSFNFIETAYQSFYRITNGEEL